MESNQEPNNQTERTLEIKQPASRSGSESIFLSPLKYLGMKEQQTAATRGLLDNQNLPVLPQYDSLSGRLERHTALASKQLNYVWTEDLASVKGLPMARFVPLEELPNIDWLLKAAGVIIELINNFLSSLPKIIAEKFTTIAAELNSELNDVRKTHQKLVDQGWNNPGDAGNLPLSFTELQTRMSTLMIRTGLLVTDLLGYASDVVIDEQQGDGLERYRAVFGSLRIPDVASTLHDDEEFGWWRVTGPNPVLIKGIKKLPETFPLSDRLYRKVMGDDDNLLTAASEGRLYLLDFVELGKLAPPGATYKPLTGIGFAWAPIVLFALGRDRSTLLPVAIQCGQDPMISPMFIRPAESEKELYWGWQMAKTVVQVAEENYHQIFVHLARTHLVCEAFCLATHRALAPRHPLHILLAPHFEGTLFINEGAAKIMLPDSGFIDVMFAARIEDIQATAGANRLEFDFYGEMLPENLRTRNVDNPALFPNYPYRDDALLYWNAIRQWVADYVAIYYTSDSDVTGDTELAAWVGEVISSGKIGGFRPIASRSQLTEVLTMIIFTASAHHAAVNFPQATMMTYAPAISAVGSAPAPDSQYGKSETDWLHMLPPTLVALEKVNIYHLLGSVYHSRLGEYRQTSFPYAPVFTDTRVTGTGGPLERFQTRLKEMEEIIRMRNQARRKPWNMLSPANVPASINI